MPRGDRSSQTAGENNGLIVRNPNKAAVIERIRFAADGISRAELAECLGLSRSTVSSLVGGLLEAEVVLERGAGASRGGRRPIVLEINADAGRVVGVDIGASHLTAILADLRGHILAQAEEPLRIEAGPEICLQQMYALLDGLLVQAGSRMAQVTSVAVGVPGPVIMNEGIVSAPPIMPGWDAFPIRQRIEDHWHKPVTLDNDADLAAVGEWAFGAGRGVTNLAYIKLGTGIGCGLLLDGHIYRGVVGTAGEIGHVTISDSGPPCTCGNYGCLEAMAGGRAIAQRASLAVKAGQRTPLAHFNGVRELTARDVALAANSGDAVSQQVLADAGRHIGSALASLINLLNPGLVVIGGGVSQAGAPLIEPLMQAIAERTMRPARQATRVIVSELGRQAVALGAVSMALSRAFQAFA